MAKLQDIIQWCDQTLKSPEFKDYAPNGLQIEGKTEVRKILAAVTASQDAMMPRSEKMRIFYWCIMVIFGKVKPTPSQVCAVNGSRV